MKNPSLYDGKTLEDVFRDVDNLTSTRRGKIVDLIDALRSLMLTPEDAATFAPMIKDYLDVWIKNDDHLLKMGTIVQRIVSAESYQNGGGGIEDFLSDADKEKLIADAQQELKNSTVEVDKTLTNLTAQTDAIITEKT